MTLEPNELAFLVELDSMIESTEEFIGDDELTPSNDPDGRFADLKALMHVREMFYVWHGLDEVAR